MYGFALYVTKIPHLYDLPFACLKMLVVSYDFVQYVIFLFFFSLTILMLCTRVVQSGQSLCLMFTNSLLYIFGSALV